MFFENLKTTDRRESARFHGTTIASATWLFRKYSNLFPTPCKTNDSEVQKATATTDLGRWLRRHRARTDHARETFRHHQNQMKRRNFYCGPNFWT